MAVRFLLESINLPRVNPRICGRRQCPPGWHIDRARLEGYLLHYVIRGSGIFTKNGITCPINAGDLFVCRPGESATYTASVQDPWDYAWVSFTCASEIESLLTDEVIPIPAATRIFTQIASCSNDPAKEWTVCGLLYQLFAMLAEEQDRPCADKGYLSKAVTFIEANYAQDLQVSQIADMLGLNRSYFCRVFKRQMGMSPQDYIVSYRLEQAEKLLTGTKLSQKEIARQVGYPDVYAFSRMFKRRYSIAPGKFRTTHAQPSLKPHE